MSRKKNTYTPAIKTPVTVDETIIDGVDETETVNPDKVEVKTDEVSTDVVVETPEVITPAVVPAASPEPEVVEAPTQEYTIASVIKTMNMTSESTATTAATCLVNFANIVKFSGQSEKMKEAARSIKLVLNMCNKKPVPEYIDLLKGITTFINADIETFGKLSVFSGIRPHRIFGGSCPPECSFIESLIQLSPTKTRAKLVSVIDPAVYSRFLDSDRANMFADFFRESV